jgi:preprotein translocase subunit SecE
MVQQFIRFFQEAYHELKLSSWLSRQEMMASTIVVIVLTIIVALYVGVIDRILLFFAGIVLRVR